jgi:DNA-binding transcriptional ArsR family regulator
VTQEKPQIHPVKPAISLAVSPRFEIFHALRLVLAPPYGADEKWRRGARAKLPQSFYTRVERYCPNPIVWPNIADGVECAALDGTFFQVLKAYAEVPPERFQYVVTEGIFHSPGAARALLAGKTTIREVIENLPEEQQGWFAFVGLFPFQEKAPVAQFFYRLFEDGEAIRDETVRLLSEFWDYVFEDTWESILPDLQRSQATLERIIPSCSLTEIADRALLNVEVDENEKAIYAGRGAYTLPFEQIERIHFLPSALNVNRLWTAFDNEKTGQTTAVFPYFDPSIQMTEPDGQSRPASVESIEPPLVFKALGNTTRFAIARIIAAEPMSSAELARRMGLTKGTVSHHVRMLRIAGLIEEEWTDGSVILSLNRSSLENLSLRTVSFLFDK